MEWIVRVNTKTGKIVKEKASQEEMRWGGRLLISKFLLREVPPTCDPLGRYNKLIIAPGLLGGQLGDHDGQVFRRGEKPADPRRQGERCRRGGGEEDRRARDQGPRPGGIARQAVDGRVEGGPGPDRAHRDARIEGQARLRDDRDSPGTVRHSRPGSSASAPRAR